MTSCRIVDLCFSHAGALPLFEDVRLHLTPGWYGLVGENGAGKTTFLRLLTGDLVPDSGSVRWLPPDVRIVLCPQDVEEPPSIVDENDGELARWCTLLELDRAELARWSTLSPGERKRWQVAVALTSAPDVLLLDEPSNHLDAEARALLCRALLEFWGIGIVVSHDRALLEELTTTTLRVHRGTVRDYSGAYGAARHQWEAEDAERRAERGRLRVEVERAERKLNEARQRRDAASGQLSTRKRMRNAGDKEARSILAKNRVAYAEARHGRTVTVQRRETARARQALDAVRVEKQRGGAIFVDYVPCPRSQLCALQEEVVRAGERTLLEDVRLVVDRTSRIHVAGPNGAGKTTLLRRVLERAALPEERVLYLPQELDRAARRRLVSDVRNLPPDVRGRVLSIAATLGLDPGALLASPDPSPGEARKLSLALGLGRQVWLLVLDEPTNHLDLPSIERVERALADYPGALLLVSHDAAFARACTETTWELEGRRIHLHDGEPAPREAMW